MARLINKLRVLAHLLRNTPSPGAEGYFCMVYAKLLSDPLNRKPDFIASAKRAVRNAKALLAEMHANPRRLS
jgi:hypothetical protein